MDTAPEMIVLVPMKVAYSETMQDRMRVGVVPDPETSYGTGLVWVAAESVRHISVVERLEARVGELELANGEIGLLLARSWDERDAALARITALEAERDELRRAADRDHWQRLRDYPPEGLDPLARGR